MGTVMKRGIGHCIQLICVWREQVGLADMERGKARLIQLIRIINRMDVISPPGP